MEKKLYNTSIITGILFLSEVILLILFTLPEFKGDNYSSWAYLRKLVWRIVLSIPLLLMIITALVNSLSAYSLSTYRLFPLLLLIGFMIILLGDLFIITNFLLGMILFLAFHVLQIINFLILEKKTSAFSIGYLIFLLIIHATITLVLILPIKEGWFVKLALAIYLLVFIISIWRAGAILAEGNRMFVGCLSLGLYLFLACDVEIVISLYIKEIIINQINVSQILNNILYYGGLIFVALSPFCYIAQAKNAVALQSAAGSR